MGYGDDQEGPIWKLVDLLIAYRWKEMLKGFDRDPAPIEWTTA